MYIPILLLLVVVEGLALSRFVYRREVDVRPGLVGVAVLALGAVLSQIVLPGAWQWLEFAGATKKQLATVCTLLGCLGAVTGALYLFLDRPFAVRKLVMAFALACAAACALQTIVVVDMRIDYPFDLEWIEGGLLDQVVRIQAGGPLYEGPDIDYVPSLYAPLYLRVVALFPYLPASPYWIGRMLSMFAILSTCVLLYHATAAATRSAWIGLLLSLCLLGSALFAGDWFDLFRVDSLFMLLALASFVVLDRHGDRAGGLVAAGALLAATVFAKQAGAFAAMAAVIWVSAASGPGLAARARRCGWVVLGGLLATAILCGIEIADSGAAWIDYIVKQLENYPVRRDMFMATVDRDLLSTPGVVLLWGAVIGMASLAARDARLLYRDPMVTAGLVFLASAVLQRSKWGGAENCLLPMLVGCLLLAAYGLGRPGGPEAGEAGVARVLPGVYLLMLVGFLWHMDLARNRLVSRVPSKADLIANQQLLAHVKSRPGPVIVPTRSHIVYQARGETSFHEIFAYDWNVQHPYPERIVGAIEEGWAETMVLRADRLLDAPPHVTEAIKQHYTCKANIFGWPKGRADGITGWKIPLPTFCERKPRGGAGAAARRPP